MFFLVQTTAGQTPEKISKTQATWEEFDLLSKGLDQVNPGDNGDVPQQLDPKECPTTPKNRRKRACPDSAGSSGEGQNFSAVVLYISIARLCLDRLCLSKFIVFLVQQ